MDFKLPSEPWYTLEDSEEAAKTLEATAHSIEQAQNQRFFELLRFGSIYLNRDMMALSTVAAEGYVPPMPKQILNVTQAICDTVVSKHVEGETKVSFEVSEGDFEAHQAAEDMDRFCWGEFNRLGLYFKAEQAFRDCLWAGDGWLKFYEKNGKVACDKVFPPEVLIDEATCIGTEPTEMYQRRYVPRSWALRAFPEQREKIAQLPTAMPPYSWPGTDTDVVQLTEGWHLASDEGEEDGRHIICCGPVCILDERWEYTTFPFARISWAPALVGAYSSSLVGQLLPLQLELGKMMMRIQHSLHLMSVPRFWQQASTKISPEYDNRIGNVYKYTGAKPEQDIGIAVSPELYQQADKIVERMYEMSRSNPMQSGNMPSRFDSQPALREAQEIADQPHAWVGINWQRLFVDCGKQVIRVAREIVEDRGSYRVFGKARGFVEQIDWADCNLDDNRFVISPQPTSLLPTTVSGKRLVVSDMFQKGLISDPNDAWDLLAGAPDIDALRSEKTAQKQLVDKQIYQMIKKRRAMVPDDCQDPIYAKSRAQAQLQLLLTKDNVPDEVLALLDAYIQDCDNLYLQANPPPPPPMAAPGPMGGPMGGPQGAINGSAPAAIGPGGPGGQPGVPPGGPGGPAGPIG